MSKKKEHNRRALPHWEKYGNLKIYRIASNLTIQEAAEKLEIKYNTLACYEGGRAEPPISIITKMCEIYNVSSDYLLGIKQDPFLLTVDKDGIEHRQKLMIYYRVDNQMNIWRKNHPNASSDDEAKERQRLFKKISKEN